MLGWMDDEALHRTLTTGRCTYWSPQPPGVLGQGRHLRPRPARKSVALDCDADTILVKVDQVGAACHTGDRTCFDADVLLRRRTRVGSLRQRHPPISRPSASWPPTAVSSPSAAGSSRTATPRSALYRKLAAERPGTFLLESAENGRSWSRYSFVGVRSAATLTERDGQAHWLGTPPVGVPVDGDPLAGPARHRRGPAHPARPRRRHCRPSPAAWSATSATTSSAGWRRSAPASATTSGCPS